ncbi:hypothetical protein VTN00DRAFT_7217 [Thermoascus crustaceus]|uniref:uncharacterized protein n=1 Tax=Thermoascus crustaceus TaxID=5088 RepID=UPI0037441273
MATAAMKTSAAKLRTPKPTNALEGVRTRAGENSNFPFDIQSGMPLFPFNNIPSCIKEFNSWQRERNTRLSWTGSEFSSEDYVYTLSEREKQEVIHALDHFKDLGLAGNEVARENFPLPTLMSRLDDLAKDLHHGKGFFSIRGLDPEEFTPEDNVLVFLGISGYIGNKRGKQDDDGYMLAHVRESKLCDAPQHQRPFRDSNLALTFHTDGFADILAMQTRSCAARGGNHVIASSMKICEELAATRPELMQILMSPIWVSESRGFLADNRSRPLLFIENGHVIMNFVRYPFIGLPDAPRAADLPPVSTVQVEALDLVELLAQKHQLVLDMHPGDLTFINNLAILHSREAFEDDTSHTRYLVRLWLKNEELAWTIPPALVSGNEKSFDEELAEKWNIVPQPRLRFKPWQRLDP